VLGNGNYDEEIILKSIHLSGDELKGDSSFLKSMNKFSFQFQAKDIVITDNCTINANFIYLLNAMEVNLYNIYF
jgi:hypothetical protein